MFSKILLPTDFSELAATARDIAVQFAKQFDSTIHVLHVDEDVSAIVRDPGDLVQFLQTVELKTEQFLDMLKEDLDEAGVPSVVARRPGVASTEIVRYAEQERCTLIVVATHGRGGFQRFFLGSTTLRLLRRAHIPVLTVGGAAAEREGGLPEKALYPTDFSEPSRTTLDLAVGACERLGARLDLLHVLKLPTFVPAVPGEPPVFLPQNAVSSMKELYRTELSRLADETQSGKVSYNVTIGGNPGQAIVEYAGEQEEDLIIIPSHGHGALHNLFFGSTAEAVVRLAPTPVLVVPPPEKR